MHITGSITKSSILIGYSNRDNIRNGPAQLRIKWRKTFALERFGGNFYKILSPKTRMAAKYDLKTFKWSEAKFKLYIIF
jgi:hypothetical protein